MTSSMPATLRRIEADVVRPPRRDVDAPAAHPLDDRRVGDVDLEDVVELDAGRLERVGLDDRAREAVEEEAGGAVGLGDPLLDEAEDDVVADERARVHHLLGRQAERRSGLDGGAQHVAGRDLRDAEAAADEGGLRSLAGARGTQQDQSHGFGPRRGSGGIIGGVDCAARSGAVRQNPRRRGVDEPARLRQVVGGVDADAGREIAHVHGDPLAVPEDAQLLEPLDLLERAVREARESPQEPGAIGVEADVAKRPQRRLRPLAPRRVSRPRDRRAREVEGMAARVEDDLDDVRVLEVAALVDRVRHRAHHALAALGEQGGAGIDQRRLDQRLVALHVDDDLVVAQAERVARLGDPIAAVGMMRRRQQRSDAVRGAGRDDLGVVRGDDDARGPRPRGLLRDADDHRHAADVRERLARQASRRQPGRNEDDERHAQRPPSPSAAGGVGAVSRPSERASLSSITGMPSRTGKARPSALQTSSWRSCCGGRQCCSGPLQSGQTSRSSRRVSMRQGRRGRRQQRQQRGVEGGTGNEV